MADNVREFVVNSLQQIYEKIRKEDFILVEGTSSAAGSSSSPYLATRWEASIPGITEVFDGLKIAYRIRTNTGVSTGGVVLSIDEENYYPVVLNANTKITTHYPIGSTILLIFNSTQTVSDVYLTSGTKTTVTGCWQIADYNTNTLYVASNENELTSEQKTHNLEVLDSLLIEDNIILSMNLNTPIDMQMNIDGVGLFNFHCQLYSCIKQNDVYHIIFNLPFMLFGFENGIYKTSTTDGEILVNVLSDFMIIDTNYNVKLPDNSLSATEKTEYTVNDIAADFSIIGETQPETNLPKYADVADALALTFVVKGNRSYGYHQGSDYYEFWFNTEDKRVRIRVYSDNSVTTYWEYIDQATNILSIIEEDEEVISTAVNELNSYVHSSYAYILQTIEDNEFVIASTLTEHDERLIDVENALENVNYEETDPTVPNYIKNITQSNINTWNTVSNCVTKTQLANQSYVTSSTLNTRLSNSSYAGYSYVYAAYSYIIDSMVSNERIIAAGFANHESRITTLEATGGEDNVQSNWNETDSTSDAYILNKPEIPSIEGLATESYVLDKISGLVNSAPETLDTLNELAAALGNDPAFATTVSTQIGERVTKTELSNQSYVTETSLQSRGYLTSFTETDPIFTASPAHSITSTDITNWNNKVSNVQANWNTTNSSDQSYILNKPEIPTTLDQISDGSTRKLADYLPLAGGTMDIGANIEITSANGNQGLDVDYMGLSIYSPNQSTGIGTNYVIIDDDNIGSTELRPEALYVLNKNGKDNYIGTWYEDGDIKRKISSNTTYIYTLPDKTGTFAMTSDMPAAVTESTVAGWGFTKNTGTLTSETDPTVPSYVKSITQANINGWNSYANVQADWNEYDSSKATYILNKPETYWVHEVNGGLYSTWGGPAGASGNGSLAVGSRAIAGGECSLAIGNFVNAFGDVSQAFGTNTTAYAPVSHAEGNNSYVIGQYSHGEGIYTYTYNSAEHAEGQYNQSHQANTTFGNEGNTIHSIGIGTAANSRKNALEIMQNGNAYFLNVGNYNGTNLTSAKPLHTVISDLSSSIPPAVTESTVSGWGFTKNAAANNATITIAKGSYTGTFTTNASTAKTINLPNELPSYSSADSGKILSVNSSGQLVWITPVSIYTGSGEPSNSTGNDGDIYLQS